MHRHTDARGEEAIPAMRWRPGLAVYWRAPGESQLGADRPLVLSGLSPEEQELLDVLASGPSEPLEVVAGRHGWSRSRVAALVERLPEQALCQDDAPVPATPSSSAWSMLEMAGIERPIDRGQCAVTIDGLGALGLQVATLLAEAGIGAVRLVDGSEVTPDDVRPGGYRPADIGRSRIDAGHEILRHAFAHVGLSGADASGSDDAVGDLVVLIDRGVSDPLRYRRYLRTDVPHLAVVLRERDVVVGPLALPGLTPCLRCVELARTEDDPRWPVIATQLRSGRTRHREPVSATMAATIAAHQGLAFVDGRPVATCGTSLLVDAVHPSPRRRTWTIHPDCGCAAETLTPGAHEQDAGPRGHPPPGGPR